jgi:DNA end-binding protein Ku
MRKIGSLNLTIGLVSIPLGINSFLDYKGISFKQLCPTCEKPISYVRRCVSCDNDVNFAELKNGFEISKDNITVIDKEVFKSLENYPTKVLAIITTNSEFEFVPEKFYLLSPSKTAVKQYFLLLRVLISENKSLVVEFVMRKKIHLAIVKPISISGNNFLMLKEILYSDKIKSIEQVKEEELTEEELKLGKQLLNLITQSVENKSYETITDKRVEILKQALAGELKAVEQPKEKELLEQLKKSVETTKPIQVKRGKKNV